MQQHAGVYLLQNYFTSFGCLLHPLSEVHKTVTEGTLEEGFCSDTMTCTRSCSYSFMNS